MTSSLLALLHVLIFVYWLGGDLGAFCASYFATDARRPTGERALALRLVNVVDTAPLVSLLLTLPSGLALAIATGWLAWPWSIVLVAACASAVWLPIALRVHLSPGPSTATFARVDGVLRYSLIAVLVVAGAAGVASTAGAALPFPAPPLFIALKIWLLAACTALGLGIRRPLRTFVAAFRELVDHGSTPEVETAMRDSMSACRRRVLGIWVCLVAAAALGIVRPV